jgi:hypothetical protein
VPGVLPACAVRGDVGVDTLLECHCLRRFGFSLEPLSVAGFTRVDAFLKQVAGLLSLLARLGETGRVDSA